MEAFNPDYLVIAMEVNELLIKSPEKWNGYKELIQAVKTRIKQAFPNLPISKIFILLQIIKYHLNRCL